MVKVRFVHPDGREDEVNAPEGRSAMQAATQNGLEGIVAECGGAPACATCHVYVDEAFISKLPPATDNEDQLLEFTASERRENSRLSCQIRLSDNLDGLVLYTPETQL